MRLRNIPGADEVIANSPICIDTPTEYKGNWKSLFGNDNPIHIEIGMGKGDFLIENALRYKDINFIGVEKYESVLCRALEKLEKTDLKNLKIIRMDAIELNEVFDKEIDTIYLNFSDPWPKKRHAKRRLTSHVFLPIYDQIFKDTKNIIQKTDNVLLFESSIVSLSTYGYIIEEISLDLESTGMENSLTEYEAKFMSQGIKINYLKATKK